MPYYALQILVLIHPLCYVYLIIPRAKRVQCPPYINLPLTKQHFVKCSYVNPLPTILTLFVYH